MINTIKDVTQSQIEHSSKVAAPSEKGGNIKDVKKHVTQNFASEEQVKSAVSDLNKTLKMLNVSRQFEVDKEIDKIIVKILDSEKKEVIRQIPSEEVVKLSKNVREMIGLLFDSKY